MKSTDLLPENKISIPLALGVPILVGACATPSMPSIEEISVKDNFIVSDEAALSVAALPSDKNWWMSFEDDLLSYFVEKALAENASIEVAFANLKTSRAILARELLSRTPSTSSGSSLEYARSAAAGQNFELDGSLQMGASWEWDWVGRVSAQIAAANATELASQELLRDTAVTIASDTALAYIATRGAQRRLQVANSNASAQLDGLNILRDLYDNGRATLLDLARAESQYHTTLASIPRLETTLETALISLRTLTRSDDPEDKKFYELKSTTQSSFEIPKVLKPPTVSTPIELVERRPDIRHAKAQLIGQLASSREARTQLLPQIKFDLTFSSLFDDLSTLGDLNTFGLGIGPSITWAGPDLRRTYANIDIADARTQAAQAVYEQAIIAAISDVETSAISYLQERKRLKDLKKAAASAATAHDLARIRFEEGLDDYLDVIDAQRTLLNAEDQLVQSQIETSRRAILIYRSMGGIWNSDDLETHRSKDTTGISND